MKVLRHASQLVGLTAQGELRRTGDRLRDPSILADGALILDGERIAWLGTTAELPPVPAVAEVIDLTGKVVVPGFVDSHTHLLFAGDRVDEWEQRLSGATYQEIAARGGGIMSTVRAVRNATRDELKALARPRLARLLSFGVTTVEVKSGYGLSTADEIKCLEAVAELNAEGPLELVPTFLGAHAVPAEYANDRAGYLKVLCDDMLPEVARCGLAEFCDVFCETGVFSLEESDRILRRAVGLGMKLKLHADELTPLGGAELAARLGAVSADHLLCITEAGIDALARSGTVATLLPGTAFFLGMPAAPARKLIERGVTVALASDCNPGTCPTENLPLVGSMACASMGMLPGEALTALTLNAAAAVGRSDRIGSLAVGKQADLIVCDGADYRHLFYHFGVSHVWRIYKRGRLVHERIPPPQFDLPARSDDPKLGECFTSWQGNLDEFRAGRPVLIGFPQDEGVRRNSGRVGAARAPSAIRHWLYRLGAWNGEKNVDLTSLAPLDLGNLVVDADLEASQVLLGQVVGDILRRGGIPIVLGGGHEEAFGHYLGYVEAQIPVGIVNIDAHLDVRPLLHQGGHSGSPFRQALEYGPAPLPGDCYTCLGAQPFSVSREHLRFCEDRQSSVAWRDAVERWLEETLTLELGKLAGRGRRAYVTIDADVVCSADVPGVSAPNPLGLSGMEVARAAQRAGESPEVASLDVVEINPHFDVDGRSARWGALVVWFFLSGVASRPQ